LGVRRQGIVSVPRQPRRTIDERRTRHDGWAGRARRRRRSLVPLPSRRRCACRTFLRAAAAAALIVVIADSTTSAAPATWIWRGNLDDLREAPVRSPSPRPVHAPDRSLRE